MIDNAHQQAKLLLHNEKGKRRRLVDGGTGGLLGGVF
jgi:hypothetical protein